MKRHLEIPWLSTLEFQVEKVTPSKSCQRFRSLENNKNSDEIGHFLDWLDPVCTLHSGADENQDHENFGADPSDTF